MKMVQKKLIADRDLTYEHAIAIAQGSEQANRNLRAIKIQRLQTGNFTVKQEPVHKLYARNKAFKFYKSHRS